jgi:hypothetical protein
MFKLFDYPQNWDEIRKKVYRRDGWRCQNCEARNIKLYAHHLIPLSEGGSNELENLITLCEECHKDMHFHMRYGKIISIFLVATFLSGLIHPILPVLGLIAILFILITGLIETSRARKELLEKIEINQEN